ncbi:MAG: tetratricopeptide repeat protein [Candidatus Promineifilaceae bacterium]
MTLNSDSPRIRSLLRQADRNVAAGKLAAAEELYRQIIDESPDNAAAWLGLSNLVGDEEERLEAYNTALELDPAVADKNAGDEQPLAPQPEMAPKAAAVTAEPQAAPLPVAQPDQIDQGSRYEVVDAGTQLFCYRHPGRATSLRCYKCNKPICSECTVKTPVGYLCPDCYREAEDLFFNARPFDYILALLVALPLSLLAGYLVIQFSRGIFFIIIMFFVGGAVGGLIGRLTKRVIGGRRGRYIPHVVAGCVIAGVLIWVLPLLLVNPGALLALIGPGVYLATAVGSAYYWAR